MFWELGAKLGAWKFLTINLSVSGRMRKGDESKISFCYPRGLRTSTHIYCKQVRVM